SRATGIVIRNDYRGRAGTGGADRIGLGPTPHHGDAETRRNAEQILWGGQRRRLVHESILGKRIMLVGPRSSSCDRTSAAHPQNLLRVPPRFRVSAVRRRPQSYATSTA